MSEIAYYQTRINLPKARVQTAEGNMIDPQVCRDILKRALEIVVEDHGGRISTDIRDADNKIIDCYTGVVTSDFPQGVGIRVDHQGTVSFVHETRNDTRGIGRKIAGAISANYNTIALQQALQQMNMAPEVQIQQTNNGRNIRITGRV